MGVLSKIDKLIWDSQRRFWRRDALCWKILVKAVHKVCHRLGVELFKGIPVHLSQSEAGTVVVIVMQKEGISNILLDNGRVRVKAQSKSSSSFLTISFFIHPSNRQSKQRLGRSRSIRAELRPGSPGHIGATLELAGQAV